MYLVCNTSSCWSFMFYVLTAKLTYPQHVHTCDKRQIRAHDDVMYCS